MAWQPPLPPGPPPRPMDDLYRPGMNSHAPPPGTSTRHNFQFQANMSYPPPPGGRSDSYRVPPRQSYRESARPPMNSYRPQGDIPYRSRPGDNSYRPQQADNSYRPQQGDNSYRSQPGDNSYRPPQGDFTFRTDAPGSIIENSRNVENRRPQQARSHNYASDRKDVYNQRSGHYASSRGRGNYRGRGGISHKAADRPMLQTNREPTPELMEGMQNDDNETVRFRPVDISSDSDEAEMDLSDENEEHAAGKDSEQPRKKQARTSISKAADGDSVPRWSNPDPYTALPPPDESQRKKTDVVKLIRKSKVVSSTKDAPKPEIAADDFISFDLGDEDEKDESINSQQSTESHTANDYGNGVPGAPSGPRDPASGQRNTSFSHRDSHQQRMAPGSGPLSAPKDQNAGKMEFKLEKSNDTALGSRKRTIDDEIKYDQEDEASSQRPQPPTRRLRYSKKEVKRPVAGDVISNWLMRQGADSSSPWCETDYSRTSNMGLWLHKEIVDFYEFVKPRPFEDLLRARLIDNLRSAVKKQWGDDADIRSFGSFPAGLYLPTADMDVVLLSKDFIERGFPKFNTQRMYRNFSNFLNYNGFALPGSIEVIGKARVPLVKYVDAVTRLKVDVSFENMTGVVAIDTFQGWKKQYPAMPIIVTLVKQFLAMRGLNEPVNGGIGGFTVTCLVTSLLQNLPSVQSGNMVPEHHLNEILMEFFNLYGNDFNVATTAIQLNPPGYIPKRLGNQVYQQSNIRRLSVIDPNNPDNDIAGGSKNTLTILESFSQSYYDLLERMGDLKYAEFDERKNQSLLSVIIGGDYSSFKIQRAHLAKLYDQLQTSS